ncbi:MAG: DUF5320 domain-containing protein [Melioribacteraceae bacterium]|nr:DUF5320 domain-containing protein [Melioribacteraceae bacterium]
MPNLNGTGPQGQGAMTGRGKGRCSSTQKNQPDKTTEKATDSANVVSGLGHGGKPRGGGGAGKGQGRGRGRGFGKK